MFCVEAMMSAVSTPMTMYQRPILMSVIPLLIPRPMSVSTSDVRRPMSYVRCSTSDLHFRLIFSISGSCSVSVVFSKPCL